MRHVFYIVIITSMLGQAFMRTALTLHYELNRADYLSRCENKNKPGPACNGKCYLKKRIQSIEKGTASNEAKMPEQFRQIEDIQLFFDQYNLYLPFRSDLIFNPELPPFFAQFQDGTNQRLFRPPCFRCS